MAEGVVAVIVLTLVLPHSLIVRPRWGVPIVEGLRPLTDMGDLVRHGAGAAAE
jgi:hypothetical protein